MSPEILGWTAAALMVSTFACREARTMRALAVGTNLAFIGYGALAGLTPVLVLHLVLLPINLCRWAQASALSRDRLQQAAERFGRMLGMVVLGTVPLLAGCGGGSSAADPVAAAAPAPQQPPLVLSNIRREWQVDRYLGSTRELSKLIGFPDSRTDKPGLVGDEYVLGGLAFNAPDGGDATARLELFSSADGMTYWVGAQAPSYRSSPGGAVGGSVQFHQFQRWRKAAGNATLKYVITELRLDLVDGNLQSLTFDECPWGDTFTLGDCRDTMYARVLFNFSAHADVDPSTPAEGLQLLMGRDGIAQLNGWAGNWEHEVGEDWWGAWEEKDFLVTYDLDANGSKRHAHVKLLKPLVLEVPLDKLPIGAEILVYTELTVQAMNNRGRESYAGAWFRDPARAGGGGFVVSGLEPVPLVAVPPPDPRPDPSPACPGPADPAAGTIAFASTAFAAAELPLGARIVLVREGGSRGDVSVELRTQDGSARAGSDYVATTQRVWFRDGQTRRVLYIPLLLDGEAEPNETVGLTIGDPMGCAAVGTPGAATLTILDDDRKAPAPPPTFSVGGTVAGLAGTGLVLEDRAQLADLPVVTSGSFTFAARYANGAAYDVRVKTPPTNPAQLCTVLRGSGVVGGTDVADIEVSCITPPPPTGLDPSFGTFGKVASDLMGSVRAIARQSSGHLVAISGTRMVRFTPDGRHDAAFGGGKGFVDNLLPTAGGEVFDIAVGPDDRIVVAGRQLQPSRSPPFFQMAAARFLPDGTPDAGFGSGGVATFRMGGPSENARRVLVQPDGRVVLVGQAAFQRVTQVTVTDNDIAIVRLNTDGTLDGSFGSGGAVTADALLLDTALAALLQPDGRIFVAGSTVDSSADPTDSLFARFGADGKYELGFARNTAYSALSDEIVDAALQPDGKIVLLIAARGLNAEVALARINPDGSLDTGFGTNGLLRGDFGPHDDAPRAVALQADGKIVVGAQLSDTVGSPDFALLRYLPDGSLDASFGSGGVMRIDFFGGLGSANDLLVQPDGRVVAAGTARSGLTALATLVRVIP